MEYKIIVIVQDCKLIFVLYLATMHIRYTYTTPNGHIQCMQTIPYKHTKRK